ncbi:hypothetical protein ACNIST_25780, partial [Escherichia coli]
FFATKRVGGKNKTPLFLGAWGGLQNGKGGHKNNRKKCGGGFYFFFCPKKKEGKNNFFIWCVEKSRPRG